MKTNLLLPLIVSILIGCSSSASPSRSYPLPPDGPMINVTQPPYNAKGDGVTDDTEALNKALLAAKQKVWGHKALVYLPDGTYLVSDTVKISGIAKVIQGQSRDRTILKLKDNCPGYQDADKPKWVLEASNHKGGSDFWNSVHHLTIDTGKSNPGAVGMLYHTSNEGAVADVLIRSGDPEGIGVAGLQLSDGGAGPGLIKHVRVEGFDIGIRSINTDAFNMVLEHIELENQKKVALLNERLPLAIRKLHSQNQVTALVNLEKEAFVVLIDSELRGGHPDVPAIENHNSAALFVRNVAVDGYGLAIRSVNGNTTLNVPGGRIEEFVSHSVLTTLPGASKKSLNLPIEETPVLPRGDLEKDWVSVRDYIKIPEGQSPDEIDDWSDAIQQAIDSGKSTVYFPNGIYKVKKTIIVRGNIQRLMGMDSAIMADFGKPGPPLWEGDCGGKPVFRIEDGKPNVVVIERFGPAPRVDHVFVEHASSQTLVLQNIAGPLQQTYRNVVGSKAGKLFVEDQVKHSWVFDHQKVWMRHWNGEAHLDKTNIINKGSDLWILGLKHEGPKTVITTRDGGRTELLGCLVYPYAGSEGVPAFVCEDGEQSLSYVMQNPWTCPHYGYECQVLEKRDNLTHSLWLGDVYKRDVASKIKTGVVVPLYVGHTHHREKDEAKHAITHSQAFYRGDKGRTGSYKNSGVKEYHGVKWEFEMDEQGKDWNNPSTPVVADEIVYFGDREGMFYAIDKSTGDLKWKTQTAGTLSPAAVSEHLVYAGGGNILYAFDAKTGQVRWLFETGGHTCFAPVVESGRIIFVSDDGFMYCADAETGHEIWRYWNKHRPQAGPSVSNETAFVGLAKGVQAVNINNGEGQWFFQTGSSARYYAVSDGMVYISCEKLYAVNAVSGREKWSRKFCEKEDPRIAVDQGRIYLGAPGCKHIYILDSKTGQTIDSIKLEFDTEKGQRAIADIDIGPSVADGVLYFRTSGGGPKMYYASGKLGIYLCAVDIDSKVMLWKKKTGRTTNVGPCSQAVSDDVVFFEGFKTLQAIY